jgi:glucosamine-6-phosphate deaminase
MQENNPLVKEFMVDRLRVYQYRSRLEMGRHAAAMAEQEIVSQLKVKKELNIIFAAAPSQNEFLEALVKSSLIEWGRINAFHMDEYIGLPQDAPQRFSTFLRERIFDQVPFHSVHLLNPENSTAEEECQRYTRLLKEFPTDIVCMGIGENGHIAFNDPPVADFQDPKMVKIVDLDLVCRQQQVNDGCFESLEEVPVRALSLTIPALMHAGKLFCMVPASTKATAVYNTLNQPVIEKYPSTILRTHPSAKLFLDNDSSRLL